MASSRAERAADGRVREAADVVRRLQDRVDRPVAGVAQVARGRYESPAVEDLGQIHELTNGRPQASPADNPTGMGNPTSGWGNGDDPISGS